jgi:hypothetical protein
MAAPNPGTRVLHAAPLSGSLRIDGRLDDPAWAAAEVATGFTESYPNPGAPARQRTEARVLYDADALYVGMRLYDTAPDSIAAQLARRDASGIYSDWAQVMVDSYHDRRTAFVFAVNPRGVQRDVFLFDDRSEDPGWDAVWEARASVDSLGWTAEFRIPLSQLRFGSSQPAGGRVWGLQFSRDVARYEARDSWAPWTRNEGGFVSRFGELVGLKGIRTPHRLEIAPYASARLNRAPDGVGAPGDPFFRRNDVGLNAGADLKYGLPSGLTLTATLNPDFGQVEADPAEVNLTAFESFFPERRPFFTEGRDIFRFGPGASWNPFYSRRIGRPPQRAIFPGGVVDDHTVVFAKVPEQTTIAGAAKLSGKTPGGWSVGLLDAVTTGEQARYLGRRVAQGDALAPDTVLEEGSTPVEPWSNYLVGRLRRDLNHGNTILGGMFTATHRVLGEPALAGQLRSQALLGGVDGEHAWANRSWNLSGFAAGSHISGGRRVIHAAQNASSRYFARPDADYLTLDTTRSSLDGYAAALALAKQGGGHWRGSFAVEAVGPGFEVNDLGFQSRADSRSMSASLGYEENQPGKRLRSFGLFSFAGHQWNYGGDHIYQGYFVGGNAQFANFWRVRAQAGGGPGYLDDRRTRGGPLTLTPGRWNFNLGLASDARKQVSGGINVYYRADVAGGRDRGMGANLELRPSAAVRVRFEPELDLPHHIFQYVRVVNDPLATATYGRRYVFANLDRTTVSLGTRLDWTFTPRLSLQFFAQPFLTGGSYSAFKELRTPGTYAFDQYCQGRSILVRGRVEFDSAGNGVVIVPDSTARTFAADPDGVDGPARPFTFRDPSFNYRSLRGSAVLRWEYRPGSTLFVVWQQQREGSEPFGNFDLGRDSRALFQQPARNVLLVKVTYWIGS